MPACGRRMSSRRLKRARRVQGRLGWAVASLFPSTSHAAQLPTAGTRVARERYLEAGARYRRMPPRSFRGRGTKRFTHASPRPVNNGRRLPWRLNLVPLPFDCACARLDRFPSPGRERASLLLRRSRTPRGDDLRASHPRSRKHGDRRLCRSLDPLPGQRSRPFHSRPGHRRIDQRSARARHDGGRCRPGLARIASLTASKPGPMMPRQAARKCAHVSNFSVVTASE
jgi:hypothetical protein